MQGQQRAIASGMGQPMPGNLNMMMANQQMPANNNQAFNPNILNPNMQPAMMHNNPMASQPQPGQHPTGIHPNSTFQNAMQTVQNRANGVPVPMPIHTTLTPQEQQLIQQRAEIIFAGMNPAAKEAARSQLPPQEVLALQSRGEDPVLLFCRRLAAQQFLNARKNSMVHQSGAPSAPGAQFGGPGSMGGMANGQMQGLLNTTNGAPMAARPNTLHQNFNGNNFRQFVDQQAHAMREQQDGHTVVPASDQSARQPGIGPQQTNLNAMQQQQQQQHQQQLRQNQQILNKQRLTQNRSAQPGMQGQNLPNQGLNMGQSTSQQSPAVGNINRPLGQPPRPESSNPQQVQARGLQQGILGRTGPQPSPNQPLPQTQVTQAQLQAQLQSQQQRTPQQPPVNPLNNGLQGLNIPERLRAQLASLPPAERPQLIAHLRNLQQQQQHARNMQPAVLAPGTSQPLDTAPKQPQPSTSLPPAQSASVSQPPMHEIGLRPGIPSVPRMTPEQRVFADQRPFLPQVSQIPGLEKLTIPEQIRTWGQLRKWLSTQPIAQETMVAVLALQEKQFLYIRRQQHHQLNAQRLQTSYQQQAPQQTQIQRVTEQTQAPPQHPEPAPTKQSLPPQQPRLQQPQQPQKQPEVAAAPMKVPTTAAPEARMGPSKPTNAQEQFLRVILSLPEELTPELYTKLRARAPTFREKSDEEIKEYVSLQKRKARQYHQQQQRNLQSLSNGQTQPPSSNQMSQQPPIQSQVPMNQPPISVGKQSVKNATLNQSSMPAKKEQNATEAFPHQRSIPEQASKVSQLTQQSAPRPGTQTNEAKKRRFQELVNEAQSAYRAGPVQSMNAESKEKMRKLLVNIPPILPNKILLALFIYFANVEQTNEVAMRQFFLSRMALIDQFEDEKCTTPKGAFTIPLESAEKFLHAFKMLYEWNRNYEMRSKAASMNAQPGQKSQPASSEPQSLQSSKSIDVKDGANKVNMERVPDAPTSENHPDSFHNISPPRGAPNGVPTYAPTSLNGLTSDHLVLPEKRKRKLNNVNNQEHLKPEFPTQAPKLNNANNQQHIKPQFPTQAPKPASPPMIRPEVLFRCTHLGCEYQRKPFPTGELLARHIEDAHKEKEPEDGLQFALDMARQALGLDINGNSIKVPAMEKSASAQTMKKSVSSQSQALRVEGGVSMSRGTTQTSNLGLPRTPQSMSRSWDKAVAGKADVTKDLPTPDSWADCPVTPVELARLFPLPEAVQGTLDMASLTPASTLASGKSERNTPNSDVADNIAVFNEDVGSRIPPSFSNDLLGFGQPFSLMDDDILDMSWDEAFPNPKRRKTDVNGGFDANLFSFHLSNEVDFF